MEEIIISTRERTLTERYQPVMQDWNIDDFTLHPLQMDDSEKGVAMLAASMEEFGQGRPVYCVPDANGKPQVIEGSRIWTAAKYSGWVSLTAVMLTKIEEDDILPLMYALKSHQQKTNYGLMAKNFDAVKKHTQKLLKESKVEGNEGSEMTTRKYMQKVFGFDNEKYVSDFEHILKSPNREYILAQLDSGFWKFKKAVSKAKGKVKPPEPNIKTQKEQSNIYMCEDCPNRKAFLDKLNDDACAKTIDELENGTK